ncbi:hypothetical protein ACO0K9_27855 [Undibacterium sp. Ji50W]|uniref:hypothetical protein n=1 Tax=Undibacterium sp. Ji50W TaxID=3413041 RepID=UPI003BF25D5C
MAARPQSDIDAEQFEAQLFAEMERKGGAGAELAAAVRIARMGRTDAGLDCEYTEHGEARFTVQQGLKAATHAREDVAATLILQVKIIERLDRLQKMSWWIMGILVALGLKLFV